MDALYWYALAGFFTLGHWLLLCAAIGVDDDEWWLFHDITLVSFFAWPGYWFIGCIVWWGTRR